MIHPSTLPYGVNTDNYKHSDITEVSQFINNQNKDRSPKSEVEFTL